MVRANSLTIREVPISQMPREKFIQLGAEKLNDEDLLAILLRTGRKGASVLEVAREVLGKLTNGTYGLNGVTVETLKNIKGIGEDKAITICAAIELGRRLGQLKVKHLYEDFSSPQAVATYMMERLRHELQEKFCAAFLNSKNKLIKVEIISTGGLTGSLAEPRLVFHKAIEVNAAAIILIHNHPSGDPTPSTDDKHVTKVFMEAGKIMGIPVLDHIIIGDGIFISLMEQKFI